LSFSALCPSADGGFIIAFGVEGIAQCKLCVEVTGILGKDFSEHGDGLVGVTEVNS